MEARFHQRTSEALENFFLLHTLHPGGGAENCIQHSDPQWVVIRNPNPVVRRLVSFQNDVTAFLMNPAIAVVFAERLNQIVTAQSTRQFLPQASNSSRTRCSRMDLGLGWSKK